jgi:hypothetical protein
MKTIRWVAALATLTMAVTMFAGAASAQATRTWVSGVGDDANPCSRTAPCKTFAGAISKTAAAGEINCLDPGGFGALTITKSISVICQTGTAGVLVSGTNGIVVNAMSTDVVVLQGLDFEGLGSGLSGVAVMQAAKVTIKDCIIRGFTVAGVHVIPTSTSLTYITDTIIDQNLYGVAVTSSQAAGGQAIANLDHVTIFGEGPGSGSFGLAVDGATGSAVLNNSTVIRSQTGLSETNGALLFSYGNNRVVQNQTNGTPNQPNLSPE